MKFSRSEQDLTLTGSRPPSACSTNRPNSAGRRGWYKKVANTSSADDMLFSSPSSGTLDTATFSAPWEKKTGKRHQMLLWAPTTTYTENIQDSARENEGSKMNTTHTLRAGSAASAASKTPKIKDTMLKTKHPYRLVKHNPTFVDEMLFGPKLEDPGFVAPWNVKKQKPGEKVMARPFHWDYTSYLNTDRPNAGRNGTKLNLKGLAQRPLSAPHQARRPASAREATRPVWKP